MRYQRTIRPPQTPSLKTQQNIALFVDVSPSTDLLNVLPHVDASASPSRVSSPFLHGSPHPKDPSKHRSYRGPCLRHVPVLHPRNQNQNPEETASDPKRISEVFWPCCFLTEDLRV
ncbi:hypothetical protein CesoFtcFv8_021698 [Champsocephalus esox]|uniref:Uncharacterized protein n=1 Tax=Champsocephalus esox TaxID=159716 RepID=A0AAN8BA97_9TELE|nr:hypothetical protein CesoFtcFv8_021698 [Champsocephalus esox]